MTAFLLFLRKVPSWVWLVLVLLAVAFFYGQSRYNAGQADVQGKWDAYKAKMIAVTNEAAELARKARQDYSDTSEQAQKAYDDGRKSGLLANQSVVDDLRNDRKRLQNGWGACLAAPRGAAPGAASGANETSGVPPEAFGRVLQVGSDADTQVTWLQAELLATRKLYASCHAIMPVVEK